MSELALASNGNTLLVNFSAPQLTYLAAEFARRGRLKALVRRYANQHRWWERALARLPAAGPAYSRTLGLRSAPPELTSSHIVQAGVVSDFAAAIVGRLGLRAETAHKAALALQRHTITAISRAGCGLMDSVDVIVAGSGTALPTFTDAGPRSIFRVLDSPSTHHRFQKRFFAEAQRIEPEFADLVEDYGDHTKADEGRLDKEIEAADLILTGSRFARDSFIAEGVGGAKVVGIPYGVDLQRFSPAARPPNSDSFNFLFVGRISSRKGVGYLLRAYKRIQRRDMRLRLIGRVAGNGACLQPYEHLFSHRSHLPQQLLPDIYRSADVFVFPSLLEGMGLVALEAMACGCPVIVSSNGPCAVVRDGIDGIVVPAADSEALEQAMLRLYEDRELCRSMAAAARAGAERYSWSNYGCAAADAIEAHRQVKIRPRSIGQ